MASITPPLATQDVKEDRKPTAFQRCGMRYFLIGFGWLNVVMGAIGIVVPGLPTTIFLLIALWAFSKSSERFQTWLYDHKTLGPPLRNWHEHRAIPLKAKVLAVTMMTSSVVILAAFVAEDAVLPLIVSAILLPVAAYIVTRPNGPVSEATS